MYVNQEVIMNEKKSMLDAFVEQTYGSRQGAYEDDKRKDKLLEDSQKRVDQYYQWAVTQLSSKQEISSAMNIPAKVKIGELDDKTHAHPSFKNYDHSLEKVIHKFTMLNSTKVGDVGEVMGDMFDGSNDIT